MYYSMDALNKLNGFWQRGQAMVLDLLFPFHCLGCGREGAALCVECARTLQRTPPSCFVCHAIVPSAAGIMPGRTCQRCRKKTAVAGFFSPFRFEDPVIRELIHGLKYARIRSFGSILGDLVADALLYFGLAFSEPVLIVPMPLHPGRQRARGFNQAEIIGGRMAERLGYALQRDLLVRTKFTAPQVGLSGSERRENVKGAFRVSVSSLPRAGTILLIDDVTTTGATMEQAARALRLSGAGRVWAITVAR